MSVNAMAESVATFSCSPRVVVTELGDGTGVLLDLESLFYFTLNQAGLVVWRGLEKGARTVDALAALLVEQFEVEAPRARADVQKALEDLVAERLVERHQG